MIGADEKFREDDGETCNHGREQRVRPSLRCLIRSRSAPIRSTANAHNVEAQLMSHDRALHVSVRRASRVP